MLIIEGLITEFRWFTVIHMESRGDSIFITANHWNEVLNPFLPLFTPCLLFLPLSHSCFSALRSIVTVRRLRNAVMCTCTFSGKDNASLCTCTWVRSLKKNEFHTYFVLICLNKHNERNFIIKIV